MNRLLLFLVLAVQACRTGRDFSDAREPRYVAQPPANTGKASDTVRIVSFNIAFSREIDRATQVLQSQPALKRADIVLLQEMDASGTKRIATALGMGYVYYPAIFHLRAKQEFGNAVLSRWPIVEDAKIQLPHGSRYAGTHGIATAATLRIGKANVRVYFTHLGTPADIGSSKRRDQLRAIIADASKYGRVVIGGDMNSGSVGSAAADAGFAWPTKAGPRTTKFGRWDHIYLRGFTVPVKGSTGTIRANSGSSDHVPVWAIGIF